MKRWEPIEREIADFRKLLCSTAKPFTIQAAYDFDWEGGPVYKESCKDGRYHQCGVYLITRLKPTGNKIGVSYDVPVDPVDVK